MHYLEIPLYSLEFVFLLVSFSDLFRIKSNRRNRTPKQQQWVANFSVTTNILPYLTVQIENIFCCCCLCISSSINLKEGQKWSACWFLDTPPPPKLPSASPLISFMTHGITQCPRLFWSMGMTVVPLYKPRARFANTVGYLVWDFCRTRVSKANMVFSPDELA